jgi:hypothetical protein
MGTNHVFPNALHQVSDLVADDPAKRPETVRATQELFQQVKNGHMWIGEPQMFNRSRRYPVENFREMNPWQPHRQLEPAFPIVSAFQLAKQYGGPQLGPF